MSLVGPVFTSTKGFKVVGGAVVTCSLTGLSLCVLGIVVVVVVLVEGFGATVVV